METAAAKAVVIASHVPVPLPQARYSADPLRWLSWLAALGVAALLLGRFLGPALPGTLVGMAGAVRAVEILGGALSQLFAIGAIVGLVIVLVTAITTNIPPWVRLLAIVVAGCSALIVVGGASSSDRMAVTWLLIPVVVSKTSALLAAAAAGGFAIVAALASRAARIARMPAAILGIVGAAAVAKALTGIVLLQGSGPVVPASLVTFGRATTTIAALLVALANILALVYIGRSAPAESASEGPANRASLWSPITIAVILLALLCARQAAAGNAADAGTLSVVLKRASDRFLIHPEPFLRTPIRLFLGFLTPLTAVGLLFARRVRTLTAALCLVLVAADVTDAPLGSITLVLASLGVLLVARSGQVLWSALIARPPATPPPV